MAGKIGQVTGQEVKTYKGVDNVRVLQVALFGANPESVVYMNTSGEDTAPMNGDMVIVRELGADKYTFGIKDLVLPESEPGEKRFYSRDSDGNVIAALHLKSDGSIISEAVKFSLGNGTDEILDLLDKTLIEFIKLVDSTLLGGSNQVDLGGTASTGTLFKIAEPLATMKTDLEAIQTQLSNIKA